MSTFKSYSAIVAEINKRTEKAVNMTAKQAMDKLTECIDVYFYQDFTPNSYIRTDAFKKSACYELLGQSMASIGLSNDYLKHEYKARYTSQSANANLEKIGQSYDGHFTGEDNAFLANAGYHGNYNNHEEGQFFNEFKSWCDSNLVALLKKNLIDCGVPIK